VGQFSQAEAGQFSRAPKKNELRSENGGIVLGEVAILNQILGHLLRYELKDHVAQSSIVRLEVSGPEDLVNVMEIPKVRA
jgi:hypothetical protein